MEHARPWSLVCPEHGLRADVVLEERERGALHVARCSLLTPGQGCAEACLRRFLTRPGGGAAPAGGAVAPGAPASRLERLLVPVAEPEAAAVVLWQLGPTLEAERTAVTLLHLVPPESSGTERASWRDALRRLAEPWRARGLDVKVEVGEGADPGEALLRVEGRVRPDLVALPTRTRRGAPRERGGLVERLLRRSPAPLLMFTPNARMGRFRRLVVALDGSPRSAASLPLVTLLARHAGGQVVLLRVGEAAVPTAEGGGVGAAGHERLKELEQSLAPWKAQVEAAGVPVSVRVALAPSVAPALLECARLEEADLLAITSHGRSQLDRWLFGSTAEQVLRYADLPLLVLRVASPPQPEEEAAEDRGEVAVWAEPAERSRRVLVPLDGSPRSASALEALPRLLQGQAASLTLLHVLPVRTDEDAAAARAELDEARAWVGALAEGLASPTLEAQARVARGDPAERILGVARELDADEVVMASHGRSGLARWVRGSVAERVLRHASCPLLVLPPAALEEGGWTSAQGLRRVLVPLDGSPVAAAVLPRVQALARRHGAEVVLLGVVPTGQDPRLLDSVLDDAQDRLGAVGVKTQRILATGQPAAEILRRSRAAGLVAMATHGRSGLGRLWWGSVTEQVLRALTRPVLLVRA